MTTCRITTGTNRLAHLLAVGMLACASASAAPLEYSGYLEDNGIPANGYYDLRLTAFTSADGLAPAAPPLLLREVAVVDGRFSVELDDQALPSHLDRAWLQVELRSEHEQVWWPLADRAPLQPKGALCPLSWELAGNAGTSPSTHFLGTTDDQAMELRVRNGRGLRLEPSPNFWNGLPLTINTLGGSHGNLLSAGVRGATMSGGGVAPGGNDPDLPGANPNVITDHYGVVAGGYDNQAGNGSGSLFNASHASVGGGRGNLASGQHAVIAGGLDNTASGDESTVAGGEANLASGVRATVGGGESNRAGALRATVSGGNHNQALGGASVVGGGSLNCAGGDYSWAGGIRAKVRPASDPGDGSCSSDIASYPGGVGDEGSFVWNGGSTGDGTSLVSSGPRQFLVRAPGGFYFGSSGGSISIPAGRLIHTSTGAYLSTGGTWTNSSARATKTGFEPIDAGHVLDQLLSLPVTRWHYRHAPGEGAHLGPMAEDFHQRFGLGDATSISTVDAAGVAFLAIQGLQQRMADDTARAEQALIAQRVHHEREIEALRAEIASLRRLLAPQLAAMAEDR
ncbi:tail fiber domain-containing protein [Pseudomarimonas arenosa]|uniref:Peptidase S74 domain-containing protein n=1 Tax=Pseudomarimonas arenosa TaxID=2774145 RepID=A0AAW3ZRU4_9GAMM|nr:tail fiber domain-containing protein [Pseudomarimonas arenosa]MBD8526961.1 hypothetical protein [Pseudomarimonas arenosa]